MGRITIRTEVCKGCGLCMAFCKNDCLQFADELNRYGVRPAMVKPDAECLGCTQCALVCPDAAIEVWREVKEPQR